MANKYLITLTKEECTCSIIDLYKKIADKAGYLLAGNYKFDPYDKLKVTQGVFDCLCDYLFLNTDMPSINTVSLIFTSSELNPDFINSNDYYVIVEDGFVIPGGKPTFDIGNVIFTNGVINEIENNLDFTGFVLDTLIKYHDCNWGDISIDDKKRNDYAVEKSDDRIFAVYKDKEHGYEIYIITERDRSTTTILLPDEY